jgi:TrmH family RNA methyltransferase
LQEVKEIKEITSNSNPIIKAVVRLQKKKRLRDESGLFVIEGYRENLRALSAKIRLKQLFFCEEWFLKESNLELIEAARNNGAELIKLNQDLFKKISYRDRPDGFLSVAEQPETGPSKIRLGEKSTLLVVESIEKPGNLGTLLRGCDAVGVDILVVCDPVTDVFNPNVVRASTGAIFSVPIVIFKDSESALKWLRDKRVRIFATTPHTNNIYWDVKFNVKSSIAVVAGAEQYGLSETWLKNSDELVKLPMEGAADSLNIAVSSIVCLYEVLRQRT